MIMTKTKNNPTVSIIIPTYNRARLIGRAIQSVLDQTYQDFELIVVDDGSTDNTGKVIKIFTDPRIKYVRHEQNKGGSVARNMGIKVARGEFIAFLDSDDEWLPKKLEKQINCFTKCSDSVGAVYCMLYMQNDSLESGRRVRLSDVRRGNVYNSLLNGWFPAPTSAVMLRVRVFEKTGIFDENLPSFQDYDLWVRVAQHYEFEFVDEPLGIWHVHSDSQVTMDLESRMKGCELFLAKWGDIVRKEAGEEALKGICKKYLCPIYQKAIFDNLLASRRTEALKYLNRLRRMQALSLKILVKAVIVFIGGTSLLNLSERIWFRASKCLNHFITVFD